LYTVASESQKIFKRVFYLKQIFSNEYFIWNK